MEGAIITPHGFVYCVAITGGAYRDLVQYIPVTRLYFAHRGKEHVRSYPTILTYIGAVRCARRFAKEIAA